MPISAWPAAESVSTISTMRREPESSLRLWLAILSALVIYGSTFPFDFRIPSLGDVRSFLLDWKLNNSKGDLLGNVALFVPWGLVWVWLRPSEPRRAPLLALASGLLLAGVAQVLQLAVPARRPQLSDAFWNVIGISVGLAIARFAPRPALGKDKPQRFTVLLLAFSLGVSWLPLVPSLDWSLVKSQAVQMATWNTNNLPSGAVAFAAAALGADLLARLVQRHSVVLTVMLVAIMIGGRLFIVGAPANAAVPLGAALGWTAWMLSGRNHRAGSGSAWVWACLAVYAIAGWAPFELRQSPSGLSMMPFASLLSGSMLANAVALGGELLIATALVHGLARSGLSVRRCAVVVAASMAFIELTQTMVATRTADLTIPVAVLLFGAMLPSSAQGWGLAEATSAPRHLVRPTEPAEPNLLWPDPKHQTAPALATAVIATLAVLGLLAAGIGLALRGPGLPYNVRELFNHDGAWPAVLVFAAALLWVGAGPVWAARSLQHARSAGLAALGWSAGISLALLLLLSLSVTEESIGDIAGSSNRYWFVTEAGDWGPAMAELFRHAGRELVDPIERGIRFVALFGPLPMLCMVVAAWPHVRPARRLELLLAGGLWLFACKVIAFDFSSTDNLNELIARDGPAGWGGGGYLYALLAVSVGTSWLMALALSGPKRITFACLALPAMALALPIGWWLIGQGLEQEVRKYELTYSALQFLLGPDRQQQLPEGQLALRWLMVHAGGLATLACGMALGNTWARAAQRGQVTIPTAHGVSRPLPSRDNAQDI